MGVSLTRMAPCFCKRPLVICMHPGVPLLNGMLKQVDKSVLSSTHLVCSLVLSNLHRQSVIQMSDMRYAELC